MLHKDATGWRSVDISLETGLLSVCAPPSGPVLITGFRGAMTMGNETSWESQELLTTRCLHATWCDGDGNMLAGGGDLLTVGERLGVIASKGVFQGGPISDWLR